METCHVDAASTTSWNTSLSRTLSGQETNRLKCWMDIISYTNTFIREKSSSHLIQTNFKEFCGTESKTSAFKVVTALFKIYNKTLPKQICCDDKAEFSDLIAWSAKRSD